MGALFQVVLQPIQVLRAAAFNIDHDHLRNFIGMMFTDHVLDFIFQFSICFYHK